MKLRVLIVDDEPLARERLRTFLAAEPAVELLGECDNGTEAIAVIRRALPDLVFLDMQMPGCNGLQVLDELPQDHRPAIIFATAHERFAVDAFAVAAVDYLLKPFDRERFRQALHRAQEHLQRNRPPGNTTFVIAPASQSERITVKADGRLVFLKPEEIVWIEAADNYALIHLEAGRLMVRETLTALEERLGPASFTRVNRSALVHRDQIRELQPAPHGDYQVVLRNGTKVPLSRNLRGQLGKLTGEIRAESSFRRLVLPESVPLPVLPARAARFLVALRGSAGFSRRTHFAPVWRHFAPEEFYRDVKAVHFQPPSLRHPSVPANG